MLASCRSHFLREAKAGTWSFAKDCARTPRKPVLSLLLQRSTSTGPGTAKDDAARRYLASKGIQDKELMDGIIKSFPSPPPSVRELESFGDAGLSSLAAAVARELAETRLRAQAAPIVVFVDSPRGNVRLELQAKEGQTFFDLAKENPSTLGMEMECACGGIAACSTCHVIIDSKEQFDSLPAPEEAELDMLDLTEEVTKTSRLGCQLVLTSKMNGLCVTLPAQVKNLW